MSQTTRLLGYPDDARLLILNADDFGMCHAINEAIFRTRTQGVVTSTTLMVPCPWALDAMNRLRENPHLSFGVHLTLICDSPVYRWRPLAAQDKVPSLMDETGFFYSYGRIPEFLAQAKLDEIELEFRSQIDTVVTAGLKPTHLDWHCLHNGGREDILQLTLNLAREYGLAVRVNEHILPGLPTNDHGLLDSFSLATMDKPAQYNQMLRELPAGLTEWAVHPGLDTPELLTIEPGDQRVRQTDYDFLMSEEARQTIEQEGIILLDYKLLQQIWQEDK